MNQSSFWPELSDLALQWESSETVIRFRETITSPVRSSANFMWTDGLGQLKTMFSGEMRQPLKIAQWLPTLIGAMGAELPTEFKQDAEKIYVASTRTLAWVRAQLPGYPSIKAPQLSRGTHRTTNEFSWGVPWRQEEYARGMQNSPFSEQIPHALGVKNPAAFVEAVVALHSQLRVTEAWKQFELRQEELLDGDKKLLSESRRQIAIRLSPAELDALESKLALPRDAHRQRIVSEGIGMLTGPAHAFAGAFERVDRIVELACIDALSHLIFNGQPEPVALTKGLKFVPGPNVATIQFEADNFHHPGEIVQFDDPLFSGLALISSVQMVQSEGAGVRMTTTAWLLD